MLPLVLPAVATLALGTALLVPLRDDRRGKRATLADGEPLRPDFRIVVASASGDATTGVATTDAARSRDERTATHSPPSDDDSPATTSEKRAVAAAATHDVRALDRAVPTADDSPPTASTRRTTAANATHDVRAPERSVPTDDGSITASASRTVAAAATHDVRALDRAVPTDHDVSVAASVNGTAAASASDGSRAPDPAVATDDGSPATTSAMRTAVALEAREVRATEGTARSDDGSPDTVADGRAAVAAAMRTTAVSTTGRPETNATDATSGGTPTSPSPAGLLRMFAGALRRLVGFASSPITHAAAAAPSTGHDVPVMRSFAEELAMLVRPQRAPDEIETMPETPTVSALPGAAGIVLDLPILPKPSSASSASRASRASSASSASPALPASSALSASPASPASPASSASSASPASSASSPSPASSASSASPASSASSASPASSASSASSAARVPSDAIVVVSATRAIERVVPLTRLPLRHHAERITWQDDVPGAGNGATRSERHATLAAFERNPDPARATVLAAAYREEDAEGRLLALGALAALPSMPTVRAVFCEALRVGTDEERARAVDAIEASGERDDLVTAFADRVDAIAAKAALAYVGTHRRDDYRRALEPYVDPRRIERLLALLAGFVE